jgi:hypothetical protein
MITVLFSIFALVIVGAAGTFVYIVYSDIRTNTVSDSKQ